MKPGNSWDHLPNASHIDMVIKSSHSHPDIWSTIDDIFNDEEWYMLDETWSKYRLAVNNDILHDLMIASNLGCRGTLMCLVVFEEAGHLLLDSTEEELRLLIALGHPYAILMLPAILAFDKIETISI